MTPHRRGTWLLLRDLFRVVATLLKRYLGPSFARPVLGRSDDAVLDVLHPARVAVRVDAITRETPSTVTLRLVPQGRTLPPFAAGQYVTLYLDIDGVEASRPYSVSSAPGDLSAMTLTVRQKPGGYVSKHILERVERGDDLQISAPAGEMVHNPLRDTDDLVFLAAGSGVTPFAAMAEDLIERDEPAHVTLLHGVRSEDELLFAQRFAELSRRSDRFQATQVVEKAGPEWKGPIGRLDARLVADRIGDNVADKTFYVCGSSEFQSSMRGVLEELSVEAHRIRVESYGPPADVTASPGYPEDVPQNGNGGFRVRLIHTNVDAPARVDESLLGSLERAGHAIPSRCRSDACDCCRVRLTRGEVFVLARGRVSAGAEGQYIRSCATYPLSDVTLEA